MGNLDDYKKMIEELNQKKENNIVNEKNGLIQKSQREKNKNIFVINEQGEKKQLLREQY